VIERLPRPALDRLLKAMRRATEGGKSDEGKWDFLPMED
jgi:hypothetical protein